MTKQERQAIAAKKWYEKNKELIAEKRRGKRLQESKDYYQKHKEHMKIQSRLWQLANPEKTAAIQRKCRSSNNERRLFNLVKNRAKNKNLDFNLEITDIVIPEVCPYLNIPFVYGDFNASMSVDRIDPTKGYIKGNIEVISVKANRMKNTATKDELVVFALNILNKFNKDL